MRKIIFQGLKSLLLTALAAGIITACQEEKPDFHFPDPVIPQKEFRHLESITPDTLTFMEHDSAVFRVRTIPYNYLSRDSLTIQIADTAGVKYAPAQIKSYTFNTVDSIWDIVMYINNSMVQGDRIRVMVVDKDTTIYSDETALNMTARPVPIQYSLSILNKDSIAAYLSGGYATIRLLAQPWDALYDTINVLTLEDTLGNSVSETYRIDSLKFRAESSRWDIMVKILDNSITDGYLRVRLTNPDTTVVAPGVINIKKVQVALTKVQYGNKSEVMNYDRNTLTFSWCLPAVTDFSDEKFFFTYSGDKITVGDSIVLEDNKFNRLNVQKPLTVSVWKYDAHKDYIIKLTNTGLPVVRINTNGQTVARRDTWYPGATMRIELPDGTVDYEGTLSLKGRGNGTWDFPKKPYALKLDEKAKILGMHKQKRWILLANYKDRTLLRNDVCLWLSRQSNLPYTVSGEFVELVWNGKHMGNYYLCEQIRIDNHRIDIKSPNLEEPEKGGYFMRIDAFLGYNDPKWADKGSDLGFWSSRYNLPFIFKDPDEDEEGNMLSTSSAAYTYMYNYIRDMETAISKAATDEKHEWMNYLDPYTAADFGLIQEMAMNHDAYNNWPKNGPKSTYMYKDSAGLMCFGPVWDFDYHTLTLYNDYKNGTYANRAWSDEENQRLYQWEIMKMTNKGGKYYYSDLKRDPQFKALLLQRWNVLKKVWKNNFNNYVDEMADKIRVSEYYNQQLWGYPDKENGDWLLTFDEAIEAMKTAFSKRMKWIDDNIGNL